MNFTQILSYFNIIYQERINSNTQKNENKRALFRKLCEKFQLNGENLY